MFRLEEGSRIYIYADYDLSTVTELTILCQRPDNSRFEKTPTVVGSGTVVEGVTWAANSYCYIDLAEGDLTLKGEYEFQIQCRADGDLSFGAIFTKTASKVLR